MIIRNSPLPLTKRHALTISRGTSAGSQNLLVEIEHDGIVGKGEMAPFDIGDGPQDAQGAVCDLERWAPELADVAPWELQRVDSILGASPGQSGSRAALDAACHDWLGKRTGHPVFRLLGADRSRIVPTSLTIGIG